MSAIRVLLTTMLTLVVAPTPAAHGAIASLEQRSDGGLTFRYVAGPGEDNYFHAFRYRGALHITADHLDEPPPCGYGGKRCYGVTNIDVRLGDLDDSASFNIDGTKRLDVTVDGGSGNDNLVRDATGDSAAPGTTQFIAGAGDDRANGGTGRDLLRGGPGDDVLGGGPGPDRISGGSGTDIAAFGRSEHYGGYGWASTPYRVTLDGRRPDGGPGDRDRLFGVEGIATAFGDDVLAGDRGPNLLSAGPGDDVIRAGSGRDVLIGDEGDDVLHSRDGAVDLVACGRGYDVAYADPRDDVSAECERVRM